MTAYRRSLLTSVSSLRTPFGRAQESVNRRHQPVRAHSQIQCRRQHHKRQGCTSGFGPFLCSVCDGLRKCGISHVLDKTCPLPCQNLSLFGLSSLLFELQAPGELQKRRDKFSATEDNTPLVPKASFGLNMPSSHLSGTGLNRVRVASSGSNYQPPTGSRSVSGSSPSQTPPRGLSPARPPLSTSTTMSAAPSLSSLKVEPGNSVPPSEAPSTPTTPAVTPKDGSAGPDLLLDPIDDAAASEYATPDTSKYDSDPEELRKAAQRQLDAYEAEPARPPLEQVPDQGKAEAVVPETLGPSEVSNPVVSISESSAPSNEESASKVQMQEETQEPSQVMTASNDELDSKDGQASAGPAAPVKTTEEPSSMSPSPSATLLRSSTSSSLRRYSVPSPVREPAAPETDLVDARHEVSSSASTSPQVAQEALGPTELPEDEEDHKEDLDDLTPSRSASSHDLPVDHDEEDMPKVKCSDCGHNVSIMQLADHVCSSVSRSSSRASLSPTTSMHSLSLRPPPSDMPLDPEEKSPGLPPPSFNAQSVPQDVSLKPDSDRILPDPPASPSTATSVPDDASSSSQASPQIDTADFPIPPSASNNSIHNRATSPEDSLPRPSSVTSLSSSASNRRSLVPQPQSGKNLWEDEEEVDEEGNGYVTVVRRL